MGAVTETVTIVFTDLVGSTALRSDLGERVADELRREHDVALASVVDANRGRVVKGAGDGIVAAFDSASDAVAAAVGMQQAVAVLARRRRLTLGLRVGISAGDVSWENGDCFGLPVVEAARLEAAAGPGQILCAEIVRVLSRGRAGVEFGPAEAFELKGLPGEVVASSVVWAPVTAATGAELPCVGRAVELAGLSEAWARAANGAGGAVLVAGELGIGKTCLLREFASSVRLGCGVGAGCAETAAACLCEVRGEREEVVLGLGR